MFSVKHEVLKYIISRTVFLDTLEQSCLKLCLVLSSWWFPLTSNCCLPTISPEYHSHPVAASDRDLCRPAGVFLTMLRRLLFILGPAVLPSQEKTQITHRIGEIRLLHYKLECFCAYKLTVCVLVFLHFWQFPEAFRI